jgi:thiol-disulfide isomerase/thioredoxin
MSDTTLYYFYSVGCGWCKKTEPLIDELNKSGYDILKLDLSEKDNQELNKQLKEKYKVQCGTPWLIDAETGNQICGFREKDIIEKWANGQEIPAPPKPKSPPPPPPQDFENVKQVDDWKAAYSDWADENNHMPNLPTSDAMLQRLKQQKQMMERQQQQQPNAQPNQPTDLRISIIEQKLDRLLKHLGVDVSGIKAPTPKQPVINSKPKGLPGPPASKKPPKKQKNKK